MATSITDLLGGTGGSMILSITGLGGFVLVASDRERFLCLGSSAGGMLPGGLGGRRGRGVRGGRMGEKDGRGLGGRGGARGLGGGAGGC